MTLRSRRRPRAAILALALAGVAVLIAGCNVFGNGLTGKTWQLSAVTETVPAFQGVVPEADRSRYTITFANDGTAAIKADCNNVMATYTTTSGSAIHIVLGPSTLVACPEDSIADEFLAGLSGATAYNVHGSGLDLFILDDGRLEFVAAR
jgi:heat shock protein HslJ